MRRALNDSPSLNRKSSAPLKAEFAAHRISAHGLRLYLRTAAFYGTFPRRKAPPQAARDKIYTALPGVCIMKRLPLFIILFIVLAPAIALNARVPVGTLAGTVLDFQGKPVAHASVTIQTSYGQHPNATYTGNDGRFQFARNKTGEYDLRASAGKVKSGWLQRIMIHSNRTTEVTLWLDPAVR
jgi:Carboxypeptidase regulatory-like domain